MMKNTEMGSKNSGSLFRYADYADKILMLLGAVGSIGEGMMTPLILLVLSGLINQYATANLAITNDLVDKYSIRLLYVAIAVGTSAFFEGVCWTRTAERQTSRIRTEYLKSLLGQEVAYFDNQDSSSNPFQVISSISTDAHTIQDVISEKIPNCIARLSEFVSGYLFAFLLSWRLALSSIPFVLGFMIPGVGFGKVFMGIQQETKASYEIAGSIAEQALSSIRTVYSYVGEHQTLVRFRQALIDSVNLGVRSGFAKGLMIGSCGLMFATWAFLSWVGSYLVSEKGETGGRVFMAICNVVVAGLGCMSALPNLSYISEATHAATRIFKTIDMTPEIDVENAKGKILAHVRGEIEFQEVHFSYPSRPNTPILQGLSLKIKAGKTVGLVGGSGSGKSTTIALIERFYDPIRGDILLDGNKIKKLQLKWLRTQIGLVNQEPILFATSIKENILFGKEDASMEKIVIAAKAANAHDFIEKLPDGYETQVGQFGAQLSGGQKQRIAIARALLKDPKILLLDEATSALDAESERVVQLALDKASKGRTTIIIAHRLSTIRKADKIVVLKSGRVVETGSHEELMQISDGVYFEMLQLQQSETSNDKFDNRYHTPEKRNKRVRYSSTPKTPVSTTPSWQNSPASPFTSGLAMSPAISIQAYSYYDSDDENQEYIANPSPSLWRLLKMNAPEWKRAFLGCLGAIGFGAVQPVHAFSLGSMVSVYFLHDTSKLKSETRTYCIIFVSLGVIGFFSNLIQHYNFAVMEERVVMTVREQMLKKVLTFEIGWFDQDENTSASICARLATEANLVRSLVGERMSLIVQVVTSASLACIIGLILTWRVSLVMIAVQPLIIASFYSRNVLMKAMSGKAQKAQNKGSQLASEAIVNHRTITAFSSQERILNLFLETLEGPKQQSIKQSWISGSALFTSQFVNCAAIALTYWYGGRIMNKGDVSSKHLFQAFFLLMSTGKNIADAGSISADIARGGNAIRSVYAILDKDTEIEPENPEGLKVGTRLKGKVEFRNVYFSYPSRPDQMIFQGLNLKIESGKTVALVGQSGSGKSTVIGLIERFYDPMKGSVLIDEKDIKLYNLRELRSHIALVSQEPTLFAGTIRENIAYGKEDATEVEIRKASKQANAEEFISSMKDGYETYCGERGVQLSGGQKQRIALARSILKNPAILLLDEATSALDSVSENLVQEALEKMMVGRTCVIVAHRLSTIQKSDSIAVIKNGKLVEQGTHLDLLARGRHGSYYSLIKLQHGQSPNIQRSSS